MCTYHLVVFDSFQKQTGLLEENILSSEDLICGNHLKYPKNSVSFLCERSGASRGASSEILEILSLLGINTVIQSGTTRF